MSEPALLRALEAAPHDDLTRSAYADWLEERGDARAEFLRLQLALKTIPSGPRTTPRPRTASASCGVAALPTGCEWSSRCHFSANGRSAREIDLSGSR